MNAPWLGRDKGLPNVREIYKDGYTDYVAVVTKDEYLELERIELADSTIEKVLERYPNARADYDVLHQWLAIPYKVSWILVQVYEWESGLG